VGVLLTGGTPATLHALDDVIISEFMASNDRTLEDEDGDAEDWIELFNAGTNVVNLAGWYLTDSPDDLRRWRFPATNLPPNAHLLVFASNKDRKVIGRPLHTNFRLDPDGEYLALVKPNGTNVAFAFSPQYPQQLPDVSYGIPVLQVVSNLVSAGAAARLLVPTSDALGATWTAAAFDDAAWTPVTTGIGYETDPLSTATPVQIADSVAEFSGTQGQSSWFYGYYDRKADANGTYETNDFIPFPRGTGNQINATNKWDGSKWDLSTNNPPWTEITSTGGHPNAEDGNPTNSLHWAVRRYVSETNGAIRITGTLACSGTSGTCGDGTVGRIFVDGVEVFSQAVFGASVGYSLRVVVTVGAKVDFAIDPGPGNNDFCDTTVFTATIRTMNDLTLVADSLSDWSATGTQGEKNWSSGYHNVTTDTVAGYQTSNFIAFPSGGGPHGTANYWTGDEWDWFDGDPPFTRVGQFDQSPSIVPLLTGDRADHHWAIRRWVSEISGTLLVDWHVAKRSLTGGGVIAVVMRNGVTNDSVSLGAADFNGTNRTVSIPNVQVGDFLDFAVLPGADAIGDDTFLNATIYGPASLSNQITSNVEAAMRHVNATVYLRVPFVLDDPSIFNTLTLRVKYDDGLVAWLNGGEIARRNAPLPEATTWNSAATFVRLDGEAVQFEEINISNVRGFLQPGTNVLAIQGLNASAGDGDFLLLPELRATHPLFQLADRNYFLPPTPGFLNGPGNTNLGPLIADVDHSPQEPADNQDLLVTARVLQTFQPVATNGVRLLYRIMHAATDTSVTMFDDGVHGDGAAGDGLYGATIPNTAYTTGQMIRYYVTATDTAAKATRAPPFPDPINSEQFYGTICFNPSLTNPLPVLHLFITDANLNSANNNQAGRYPCSLYYLGEFYDNVGLNRHGQSSQSAEFLRKSYDIDFNPDHHFRYAAGEPRVDDINLLTTYPDKAKMRNMLAYDTYKDADGPYHFVHPVRVQTNGGYFGDWHVVENGDADYLKRLGRDPNGALYKMYNQFNDPASDVLISPNTEAEKKTRRHEGNADLVALMNGVSLTGAARAAFAYDNINIPESINMTAARDLTADLDCCHKNYYFYRDSDGSGEWEALPWDVDLSFGRNWTECSNYWGDNMHPENGIFRGGGNRYFDALYGTTQIRQMYLRRLRTLMDELLQPPGTPVAERKYEAQMDAWLALLAPDAELEKTKWATWGNCASPSTCCTQSVAQAVLKMKTEFMDRRRTNMFSRAGSWAEIPTAQPSNAVVLISAVEFNPVSGNQLQEYIELRNTNNYSVDISGWTLSGAVDFTFVGGTVIVTNSVAYVTPDKKSFRARTTGPRGGQSLLVLGPYQGQLSARGEAIILTDKTGRIVHTNLYPGNPTAAQLYLRVTEIMYHPGPPAPGSPYFEEDFEYLELRNISTNVTLSLTGLRFVAGVEFDFTGSAVTSLAPGQTVLVVKNIAAFTSRYGGGFNIAGEYIGFLDNGGETLRLDDAVGEKVLDFRYNNSWYQNTDGPGFSLVIVDEHAAWNTWDERASWRPSAYDHGSPGAPDPPRVEPPPVLITEVLTHSGPGLEDAVEVFNPNATNVDIGGWFLSDDLATARKYRVPDSTVIPPGGFLVFYESEINPTNPPSPTGFAFDATGDEAFLFSGNGTNLTGWFHGFDFGAAESGVSFGQYVNSQTQTFVVPLAERTLGTTNSLPKVGPVVLNEIHYHPPDLAGGVDNSDDEFVELLNLGGSDVPLFHPAHPINTWRLRGGVDFDFPAGVTLPAGGYALVVNFHPTNTPLADSFRARFNVPTNVPLLGPLSGKLDNSADEVELQKPNDPVTNQINLSVRVPYVLVEEVDYQDASPWQAAADGLGPSLQRLDAAAFGNEPLNWLGAAPSAGRARAPGTPPGVTTHPADVTALEGGSATFTVTATGTEPLSYQWRRNGANLSGQTGPTLTLTGLSTNQMGNYSVVVFNVAGSTESSNAVLDVLVPVKISQQPASASVNAGSNVTFTVVASSARPISYQWRSNGVDLAGATNSTLTLTNVQLFVHEAAYSVLVSDSISSALSSNAILIVLVRAAITAQPTPTNQNIAAGSTLTISISAYGTWPLSFRWRKGGTTFTNIMLNSNVCVLAIPNAQSNLHAGIWTVAVTNLAGAAPLSSNAVVGIYPPTLITNHPQSQTTVAGSNVTFTVGATGYPVLRYQWFFNDAPVPGETNTTLALTNVQATNEGAYYATVSNILGPLASSNAVLTLDSDADTLPDSWELSYGLNPTNNADAAVDSDGDTLLNWQEYLAGTDPTNRLSYLRIDALPAAGGNTWLLTFNAVAGRSYTIVCRDWVDLNVASNLVSFAARTTNAVITVTNQAPPGTARLYQLVTPRLD
jgi:hypothetical protein